MTKECDIKSCPLCRIGMKPVKSFIVPVWNEKTNSYDSHVLVRADSAYGRLIEQKNKNLSCPIKRNKKRKKKNGQ